jgi:hypothetical protein
MPQKQINDDKVMYRLDHFKDFQKTLVTINGGVIIAVVAYMSSLPDSASKHASLGLWGIGLLAITLMFQIFLSFFSYFMLGYIYDGDDELAKTVGKVVAVPLTLLSLTFTPAGFLLLFIFLAKTLG